MANKILLEVVTPQGQVLSREVDVVTARGVEGEFSVLHGHTNFLTPLKIAPLRYRVGEDTQVLAISGGLAEVTAEKVTILAESAERPDDIDVGRAEKAKQRAMTRLGEMSKDELDVLRAEMALQRSINRLNVAQYK